MISYYQINSKVYSSIQRFTLHSDGSISADYCILVGEDINKLQVLATESKYINPEQATSILSKTLSKDDIGKTPTQITLDNIYNHLKEIGEIIV